ncbi:MAG: transposase [Verrucomicrobiia bacterium]|jgi:REP element-mobilizing transposase RayT
MARQVRIEYPGARYHVMSRGDHQEAIYRDDEDRERFLGTLEECGAKTGWLIHAYVLMGNHYHLLLETPEPNLVTGMKWFQGVYTQRFNGRHKLFTALDTNATKGACLNFPAWDGVLVNPNRCRGTGGCGGANF